MRVSAQVQWPASGQRLRRTRNLVQLALSIPHGVVRKPPHVLTGRVRRQGFACNVCGRLWASGAGRHEMREQTQRAGPVAAGLHAGSSRVGRGAPAGAFLSTFSSSVRSWQISDAKALLLLSWSTSFCCHRLHEPPSPSAPQARAAGRNAATRPARGALAQHATARPVLALELQVLVALSGQLLH